MVKSMKKIFWVILFLHSVTGCFAQKKINLDDLMVLEKVLESAVTTLVERESTDGSILSFLPGQELPFTGWRKQIRKNGEIRSLEQFKDGKSHGLYRYWWKNGVKSEEKNNRNGMAHGIWLAWYEDGGKQLQQRVRNGKLHGPATRWYRNGQKKNESFYQDGKIISIVVWKPDGEKCKYTHLIDGDGLWVRYREDGTESWRSKYKNGLFMLEK